MKYSFWLILGFVIAGSQIGYSQGAYNSGKIDAFVREIEQLEKSKGQWVDSLIRVAMDTAQSGEVRRAAFMQLGNVKSEKALEFLVDNYNTRIFFAEGVGLGDQYPVIQSIFENHVNDFTLVDLVFQSLGSGEKSDTDIALLAMIVMSVVENTPDMDKEVIPDMVKNRRKAIGYRNISESEKRNLDRFVGFFY